MILIATVFKGDRFHIPNRGESIVLAGRQIDSAIREPCFPVRRRGVTHGQVMAAGPNNGSIAFSFNEGRYRNSIEKDAQAVLTSVVRFTKDRQAAVAH